MQHDRRLGGVTPMPGADRPLPVAGSALPPLPLLLLAIAFVWCYGAVVLALAGQWWSNNMYNYGFLIPVIAAYLVWADRDRVARAVGPPSYRAGVPVLAAGLALLAVGVVGSLLIVEEFSLLATLAGLVLLGGGVSLLRAVALPLAYLLFMIPFWEVLITRLYYPLQISTAILAEAILRAVQIPVHRIGTMLALPTVVLEVAEACSGVNFLVAIAAISLPYVYLTIATTTRRLLVVAFAFTVAMASNGVRVALIGMSQQYAWWDDLHGPAHLFHGMVIAIVGYAALFVGAHYLGGPAPRAGAEATPRRDGLVPAPLVLARPLVTAAVLLAIAAALQVPLRAATPGTVGDAADVPLAFADWVAAGTDPGQSALRAADADHELARSYRSPTLGQAHLYVGYFAVQVQGHELAAPPAAVAGRTAADLALDSGEQVRVTVAHTDGPRERVVLYWYDVNGGIAPDPLRAKGLTIWNGLLHHRTSGALVAVTVDPAIGVDRARAEAAARALAREALPAVRRYVAVSR